MSAQTASARVLYGRRSAFLAGLLILGVSIPESTREAHAQRKGQRLLSHEESPSQNAPQRGGTCQKPTVFSTFNNIPIGDANVQEIGGALVVSNLGVAMSAPGCTLPGHGVEVCLNPVKDLAGEQGGRIELIQTSIPDNVTHFFVQLEEYWGLGDTTPAWETDPIPVGFRTDGGVITACAGFNQCPIKCDEVEVQFKATPYDESPDTIICPSTDLFSISDTNSIPLRRILVHGACRTGGCSESEALDNVAIEFVLGSLVSGFVEEAGCTPGGMGPYSARSIVIKPNRPCLDDGTECQQDSCCDVTTSASGAASRGANTPPMESVKLMADYVSESVAGTTGQFVILDEAVCSATETVCDDNFDDDCDGRVDSGDPDCPPLGPVPAASAWGIGIFAIGVCIAAVLVLRRTPYLGAEHG